MWLMDLSIIIVTWNSQAHLEKCLTSVYVNTQSLEFETIVVDNGSFDGSGEMIARRFPQVKFIQSRTNVGFATANNLAYALSSGRALLFLNPDTELIGDALTTLFSVLRQKLNAGVVGARLLNSDGTVQTSCIQKFPSVVNQAIDANMLRMAFPRLRVWGTWPLLDKQPSPIPVDVISGACSMIRREVFEQVGLFSADYFMYSEDVDLCFKVRQTGFTNYYVDDATVVHHGGISTSKTNQSHFSAVIMKESLFKYFSLRHGRVRAVTYRTSVVLMAIVRCTILFGGVMLTAPKNEALRGALSKWLAVFQWGIGIRPVNAGR